MKKARVLLVTPRLVVNKGELNRMQPPLGLMIFAQMLIDDGHTVKIHDFALEGWDNHQVIDPMNDSLLSVGQSDEDIASLISEFSPDILAISVMYSTLMEETKNLAKIAKRLNKKTTVVIGGNCISNAVVDYKFSLMDKDSNLPDYITHFDYDHFDFAITGEAEFGFLKFVNAIANNTDTSKIPGLIKKIGEKKYMINPPEIIKDLNLLPRPPRHLVNMEGYFDIGQFHSSKSRSNRVLNIMCSRGCPEKCTFCTTPEVYGQTHRWRSTENIMNEIKNDIKDFKIGELQFDDDTLTGNRKNLMKMCAELEKIGLPWCTPNGTKVNYHLKHQLDMYKSMADSGCYQITLACESGVQRVLDDIINKRLPMETIYPSIENAKKAGMLVHTFWILGFPGETYEEMQRTIKFAFNSGSDSFTFSILQPLAGSPIYRKVWRNNLWWNARESYQNFRNSLIKVDGFKGPREFERFIHETNIQANLLLKEKDPDKFRWKYGEGADDTSLMKQT